MDILVGSMRRPDAAQLRPESVQAEELQLATTLIDEGADATPLAGP